jgi:hypothetical protein
MNAVGIWPEIENRFSFQFIGSLFILLYFVIIPQMIDLYMIHSDIDLVAENLATANIAITISLIKLLTLWYNKKGRKIIFFIKNRIKIKAMNIVNS